VSTIASDAPVLSLRSFVAVIGIAAAWWVFALLMEDDRFYRGIGPIVAIALLLLAPRVILWRYDEGLNEDAYHVSNNAWVGKLQLTWVFSLFAPLLLAWFITVRRRSLALLYASTWALSGIALYSLLARMGLIVFGMTTVGVWIFTIRQSRRTLAILIVAAAIGGTLIARTGERARNVVAKIAEPSQDEGVQWRLSIWKETIRLFRSRPITGHGLGTYDIVAYTFPDTVAASAFRGAGWHAHNVYLHMLAETGVLGAITWCWLWAAIVVRLLRAWMRAGPAHRAPLAGAFWAVAAFLVLSISEVMIGTRVYASFRMNLTLGLVAVLGLSECARATDSTVPRVPSGRGRP
jgi:O-antigen ligase